MAQTGAQFTRIQESEDVNGASNRSTTGEQGLRAERRSLAKLCKMRTAAVVGTAWLAYSYRQTDAAALADPTALPQVVVSKPLVREVNSRLGFLGQFSAVDQVELRAQVGGTLTGIHFKDGDIVHKGDLLFVIDSGPLRNPARAGHCPTRDSAAARLGLAKRELTRAQELIRRAAGTAKRRPAHVGPAGRTGFSGRR